MRSTRPMHVALAGLAWALVPMVGCGKATAGDTQGAAAAASASTSTAVGASLPALAAQGAPSSGDQAAAPAAHAAAAGGTPTDANYEGTYRSGAGEIKLARVDANRAKFDVYVQGPPPSYNSGFATGDVTVDKTGATYTDHTYGSCSIRLDFAPGNTLHVTQPGVDCGFGFGVYANGVYTKVSSARPTVGVDPRAPGAPVLPARAAAASKPGEKRQGSDPAECPDGMNMCAANNCVWCVPPGGGCDSPGDCINHHVPAAQTAKPPAGHAASTQPKGAIGKCAPGEVGGVGYFCKNGFKYPS